MVRTAGEPGPLVAPLTATVRAALPELPAYKVFPVAELVDRSLQARRFVMVLLTAFAAAALLLACVGAYGAASQAVAQRTRGIGVRMALGASPHSGMRLVLAEGMRLSAAGTAAGVLASLGLTRLLRGLLFGVQPLDPAAFVIAALSLAAITLIACYIPARRATSIDALVALRHE